MMPLEAFGQTDVGRRPKLNEDNFLVRPATNPDAVCDGMGGHHQGQVSRKMAIDTVEHRLQKGDVILLCSDGLHSMINDQAILKAVTPFPATLTEAAQKLIDAANEAGGKDNVSVVLLRYTE